MKSRALNTLGRAHYQDAALYDHRYARRSVDVDHYVALGKAARGPVLELGAGTGRITLPLAIAGVEVIAVERESGLRARLRDAIAARGLERRVTVVAAD